MALFLIHISTLFRTFLPIRLSCLTSKFQLKQLFQQRQSVQMDLQLMSYQSIPDSGSLYHRPRISMSSVCHSYPTTAPIQLPVSSEPLRLQCLGNNVNNPDEVIRFRKGITGVKLLYYYTILFTIKNRGGKKKIEMSLNFLKE